MKAPSNYPPGVTGRERQINPTDDSEYDMDNPMDFVKYLETTLIPDLKESDHPCTAADFETACRHISNLHEQLVLTEAHMNPVYIDVQTLSKKEIKKILKKLKNKKEVQ